MKMDDAWIGRDNKKNDAGETEHFHFALKDVYKKKSNSQLFCRIFHLLLCQFNGIHTHTERMELVELTFLFVVCCVAGRGHQTGSPSPLWMAALGWVWWAVCGFHRHTHMEIKQMVGDLFSFIYSIILYVLYIGLPVLFVLYVLGSHFILIHSYMKTWTENKK